jgi:hypothetical protein
MLVLTMKQEPHPSHRPPAGRPPAPRPGERLALIVDPDRLRFFDPETETAI